MCRNGFRLSPGSSRRMNTWVCDAAPTLLLSVARGRKALRGEQEECHPGANSEAYNAEGNRVQRRENRVRRRESQGAEKRNCTLGPPY